MYVRMKCVPVLGGQRLACEMRCVDVSRAGTGVRLMRGEEREGCVDVFVFVCDVGRCGGL
jgi:hypothetical protein